MAKNKKYDGLHITLLESQMVHPTHADGFVDSGDPVVIGQLVGVALQSGAATTDLITVDTVGVYELSVLANDGAAVAVAVGDALFINATTAVISKTAAGVPFGHALETVSSGATSVIDVRIQQ